MTRSLFSVKYRSLDRDGKLWTESSDPAEVLEHAAWSPEGGPYTFQKAVTWLQRDGWEPWAPEVDSTPTLG